MKPIFRYFALTAVILAAISATPETKARPNDAGQNAVVRAKLDTLQATMGDRVWLRIEVLKKGHNGAILDLPKAEPGQILQVNGAEVRDITVDSVPLPNGRMQLNYGIQVQPFEPGTIVFPKFRYVIDKDTFSSDITTLKVIEPVIPKEMLDSLYINPMEGVQDIPARWYDYVPDWWYWGLTGFAVIALIVTLALLYKKNGPSLLPHCKYIPPHILAYQRLKKLQQSRLAENGHEKAFYTELTEILRQYLGGRFHIMALEMSTTQILDAMRKQTETADWVDRLRPVLETADFVKFAKLRPLPHENTHNFNTVSEFVDKTKPIEVDPDDAKKKKHKKSAKKSSEASGKTNKTQPDHSN